MEWLKQGQKRPPDKILEGKQIRAKRLETPEGWKDAYLDVKIPFIDGLFKNRPGLREALSGSNINPDDIDGMEAIAERFHIDGVNAAAAAFAIKNGLVKK